MHDDPTHRPVERGARNVPWTGDDAHGSMRYLPLYEANKDVRDEEAFKAVDVNNDGELQEDEVLHALTPEHPTHEKFHRALGFNTDSQQREQCAQQ